MFDVSVCLSKDSICGSQDQMRSLFELLIETIRHRRRGFLTRENHSMKSVANLKQ